MGEQLLLRGEAEIPCVIFAQVLYCPGRRFLNVCGGVKKVRFGLNFWLLSLVMWEERSQTLYLSFHSVVPPASSQTLVRAACAWNLSPAALSDEAPGPEEGTEKRCECLAEIKWKVTKPENPFLGHVN